MEDGIRNLIIGILLFSVVITATSIFISDIGTKQGVTTQDLSHLSQANVIANKTVEFENTFNQKITGNVAIDSLIASVTGFIEFIDLVGTALFGFWDTLINGVGEYLFIPVVLVAMFITIIIVYILFEITSAIVKWRV